MSVWDSIVAFLYGKKATALGGNGVAAPVVSNQPGTGALLDTRTDEQKQTDIQFAEIVSDAAVVSWPTKAASAWRSFVAFNQTSCDACVAFSMAKILGVMQYLKNGVFVVFSPGDIYRRRSNVGSEGMNSTDPYYIAAQGVTLDAILPSQNLTEEQINTLQVPEYTQEVGRVFKVQNPKAIVLPVGDIDAIASVIQQTGKAVMVWFYFTSREWSNAGTVGVGYNVPKLMDSLAGAYDANSLRHSVVAVDFTMYGGKKALIVEDSAWFGGFNRRIITEDFFNARNFFAGYPMNFAQVKVANALPKYTFKTSLQFIPWDDANNAPANQVLNAAQLADVKALQLALQSMTNSKGITYFPTNVAATGYYGALTASAVYAWGCDHLLPTVPQSTLDSLGGTLFGAASVAEMNAELT